MSLFGTRPEVFVNGMPQLPPLPLELPFDLLEDDNVGCDVGVSPIAAESRLRGVAVVVLPGDAASQQLPVFAGVRSGVAVVAAASRYATCGGDLGVFGQLRESTGGHFRGVVAAAVCVRMGPNKIWHISAPFLHTLLVGRDASGACLFASSMKMLGFLAFSCALDTGRFPFCGATRSTSTPCR